MKRVWVVEEVVKVVMCSGEVIWVGGSFGFWVCLLARLLRDLTMRIILNAFDSLYILYKRLRDSG